MIQRKLARTNLGKEADAGAVVLQNQDKETEENNIPPPKEGEEKTDTVTPIVELYLPDLDNTLLSRALKEGIKFGLEDEVMVECPKLKPYFGVDTLLVQAISGRVRLYTNDEIEPFPIHCSRTKFSLSLLYKALRGVEKQRATPKELLGEHWPQKLKTILSKFELDQRCICRTMLYVCKKFRYSQTLPHGQQGQCR